MKIEEYREDVLVSLLHVSCTSGTSSYKPSVVSETENSEQTFCKSIFMYICLFFVYLQSHVFFCFPFLK